MCCLKGCFFSGKLQRQKQGEPHTDPAVTHSDQRSGLAAVETLLVLSG